MKITTALFSVLTLVLPIKVMAASYAIPTTSGVKVVLNAKGSPQDWPTGYIHPVDGKVIAQWKNGSVTESSLTYSEGVIRKKTETEILRAMSISSLKDKVAQEINTKTETLTSQGFTATISSVTYTFKCEQVDIQNSMAMRINKANADITYPQVARLTDVTKGYSGLVLIMNDESLEAYASALASHLRECTLGGVELSAQLAISSSFEEIINIREVNNMRGYIPPIEVPTTEPSETPTE